jgi:hypothetical protein
MTREFSALEKISETVSHGDQVLKLRDDFPFTPGQFADAQGPSRASDCVVLPCLKRKMCGGDPRANAEVV